VAQQELESSVAEMARAAAVLFHEGSMVSVTVCYSDGSAWQPSLGCESLGQGEWEPVLARTLHSALDRTLPGQRQLVCVTVWFSDKSGVQFYVGSGEPPEAGDDLSQCKQAITRALHDVHHRLTTNKVIEELRARDRARVWFLPVVLPGGEVPDRLIGAGETLRDFNYIVLSPETWPTGVQRLVRAIKGDRS